MLAPPSTAVSAYTPNPGIDFLLSKRWGGGWVAPNSPVPCRGTRDEEEGSGPVVALGSWPGPFEKHSQGGISCMVGKLNRDDILL